MDLYNNSYILVCQYYIHASLYAFQNFNIFTLIPDADDVTLDMEVTEMKLGDYLEIGKKLKAARTKAGISQRNMASKLELNASTYSNYENGYSEPPVETLEKACAIMGITMKDLLEVPLPGSSKTSVTKFSELLAILIDLDRRGLPITASTTLPWISKTPSLLPLFRTGIDIMRSFKRVRSTKKSIRCGWRIPCPSSMFRSTNT